MTNMENAVVKKKLHIPSMTLGVVGIVFSVFLPIIAYACSIPGLIIGIRSKKKNYNNTAGLVLNIVAISLAVINTTIGIIMTIKIFASKDKKNHQE